MEVVGDDVAPNFSQWRNRSNFESKKTLLEYLKELHVVLVVELAVGSL